MALPTLGLIATAKKENELRVPIHPDHLDWIPEELRKRVFLEKGYGRRFGVSDESIASRTAGLLDREEILRRCGIVVLPKPLSNDLEMIREDGILWGWPHCVQQERITDVAIERRLTLIAWEAMHKWKPNGEDEIHIFYKNNEMAGYAGVLDALRFTGIDGHYGPRRRVMVISFGSVSRGAVYALQGRGFSDITVFTQRPSHLVANQVPGVDYRQIRVGESGRLAAVNADGTVVPFIEEVSSCDVIVNGILQNSDKPLMFVHEGEVDRLRPECLIIDVSCDEGMGFPFARPTSFENPIVKVGSVTYYAVDHTPSYLWNSASWEISRALIPFLPAVMGGSEEWDKNETIRRAIEIRSGTVQNPKILSFQKRSSEYPHAVMAEGSSV